MGLKRKSGGFARLDTSGRLQLKIEMQGEDVRIVQEEEKTYNIRWFLYYIYAIFCLVEKNKNNEIIII